MDPAPYRDFLSGLVAAVRDEKPGLFLEEQLHALRRVLVLEHKFQGESTLSDDPQSANLMQVIDRRQGVAPALGVLYLHVAEKMGWSMMGIDYAGHFLVRLGGQDGAVILDPTRAGQTCTPEALLDMSAMMAEDEAFDAEGLTSDADDEGDADDELSSPPSYAVVLTKRDILLRLQNNLKRRQLAREKLDAAIGTLQGMILLAPRRPAMWRELSHLQAERGSLRAAITALEMVQDLSGAPEDTIHAEAMLRELRWRLN